MFGPGNIIRSVLSVALVLAAALTPVAAEDDAYTLEGKTIRYLHYGRGGSGADLQARLLAELMSEYLPGNPTIIVQGLIGAGGLRSMEYLSQLDPREELAIISVNTSLPFRARAGTIGDAFDPRRIQWIGGYAEPVHVCIVSARSGISSVEDLRTRPIRVGGVSATGSGNARYMLLVHGLGLKLETVLGYQDNQSIALALARGEVDGMCVSLRTFDISLRSILADTEIRPLVYLSAGRRDDIEVPFVLDMPIDEERAEFVKEAISSLYFGRAIAAGPDADPKFVEAFRTAFQRAVFDPGFVTAAEAIGEDLRYISKDEIEEAVDDLYAIPDERVTEIGKLLTILE